MILCKLLNIKLSKFTTYYTHTDKQTELVNQVLEAYLHNFGNYNKDYLYDLLPRKKFADNNSEGLGPTPFPANYTPYSRITRATDAEDKNPARYFDN